MAITLDELCTVQSQMSVKPVDGDARKAGRSANRQGFAPLEHMNREAVGSVRMGLPDSRPGIHGPGDIQFEEHPEVLRLSGRILAPLVLPIGPLRSISHQTGISH